MRDETYIVTTMVCVWCYDLYQTKIFLKGPICKKAEFWVSFPTTPRKLKLCQLSSQSASVWWVTNSNKIWPLSPQNTIYTPAHILLLTNCPATYCNFNIIQILLSPSVPRHKDRVEQSTNTESIRNTFSWRWNCFIFIKQLSFTNWQNKRAIIVNTQSQHEALHLNRDS